MPGQPASADHDLLFDLVDKVLASVRRGQLDPSGPQCAIVEATPGDRVLQILAGAGSGKTETLVWLVLSSPGHTLDQH